ncbi:hypothetical protein DFP72DRAFT_1048282 [Ephemerocybe angulata]|uniref:Uncharacterized protein n=1 Tax=Ephemerocybe angulata TaxID=980116 RepID=A0A8H6HRF2_9AGAR|nr:hypothetical protein DFP72DRAFT_1048282 [Tulosesus angulatus]
MPLTSAHWDSLRRFDSREYGEIWWSGARRNDGLLVEERGKGYGEKGAAFWEGDSLPTDSDLVAFNLQPRCWLLSPGVLSTFMRWADLRPGVRFYKCWTYAKHTCSPEVDVRTRIPPRTISDSGTDLKYGRRPVVTLEESVAALSKVGHCRECPEPHEMAGLGTACAVGRAEGVVVVNEEREESTLTRRQKGRRGNRRPSEDIR